LVREFLRRNKKRLVLIMADLAWFITTVEPAYYVAIKFPLVSLETLCIYFLGGAAYMLGMEVIEPYVARKVR